MIATILDSRPENNSSPARVLAAGSLQKGV